MRLLVCGGRDFLDRSFIWACLDRLHAERPIWVLMHGGARGVDSIADGWARLHPEIRLFICRADWSRYGKKAGPLRNTKMLLWKPDLVLAFPGGPGTADMVRKAEAEGVSVLWKGV